ncbi:MAG: hypothetical protein ACUVXH_09805 [Anaerolineae bacterium]
MLPEVLSDDYWTTRFEVTKADLDRIANYIRETRQAHDLTALAHRVVRGRIRYGPETSAAARETWSKDPSVRLWDPAATWQVGDRVVVARRARHGPKDRFEARMGEIVGETTVQREGRTIPTLVLRLDGEREPAKYELAPPGSEEAERWRRMVEAVTGSQRASSDLEEQVEGILLQHGARIVSQLLEALQSDSRFLELEGRWFLRSLLTLLTAEQMASLYHNLLGRVEPLSTEDLLPLVQPPPPEGSKGLFSLYAALCQHPNRFANRGTPTRPLWKAVPPPPERAVGACYAYDPETYEILLSPGQRVTDPLAQRLQELGLYDFVVKPAGE